MSTKTNNNSEETGNEKIIAELEDATHSLASQLKTPIVSIRGFLGFVEQDINEKNIERAKADLARIGDAADKMYLMINGLLEFSNAGKFSNPLEDVPFEEIVLSGLNNVEESVSRHNIQVHIQPDMPIVYVDLTRMIDVIQKLIENAIQYLADQSEPKITFGTRLENDRQIFFISDNGIGIDKAYHQSIFNIFEKLDPQSEGIGSGLAIVKRIIELHEGKIWAESEGVGKGSTFCFTLPPTK